MLVFCAFPAFAQQASSTATQDMRIVFPSSVSQGALVLGKVPPGSKVRYAGRDLRVSGYGSVVFGVGRDE
ncbi:MAG TPA: M23 family peptidase, partial [Pseudoxanthomonas sp.]|nr:M23 family peptidase [Pseudoxanthomonas sp.]